MIEPIKKHEPGHRKSPEPMREPEEEHIRLMLGAAKGDQEAYAEIYEIYRPTVRNFLLSLDGQCSEHDREDMLQEVFRRGPYPCPLRDPLLTRLARPRLKGHF